MSAANPANAGPQMTAPLPSIDAAMALLRAGDAAAAKSMLEALGSARGPRGDWQLAAACRQLGDMAGEKAALTTVLTAAPRDIGALLARADLAAREGDERAQLSFLRTAIAQAEVTPPPPQARPLVEQARATAAQVQASLAARLNAVVEDLHLDSATAPPALRHAVALLRGEVDLHLQQPSMFYYPGLPQRAWYERSEFAWMPAFEAETPRLQAELQAVLADAAAFAPYVERAENRPAPANHLLDDPSWGAAHIWRGGELADGIATRAPATISALAQTPQPVIAGRSPMALWSRLRPGTHITPHHGLLNTRLICHLPLIAPDGCGLRVGHETRHWRAGEMLIFDDSFEHEAWNRGSSDRIVLLFEIWRPEVPMEDRALLARLFEALDFGTDA